MSNPAIEVFSGTADFPEEEPLTSEELDAFTDEYAAKAATFATPGYYIEKWRPVLLGKSSWNGFNGAAFLTGILWCLYRKMYGVAAGIFAAEFLIGIILIIIASIAIAPLELTNSQIALVSWLALIPVRLWLGLMANKLYLKKAKKVILESRSSSGIGDAALKQMRSRGGISGWALGFGWILNVALTILDRMAAL